MGAALCGPAGGHQSVMGSGLLPEWGRGASPAEVACL